MLDKTKTTLPEEDSVKWRVADPLWALGAELGVILFTQQSGEVGAC